MTARRNRRSQRGSMSVEIVLLAPVLMAFVLLIVAFGRLVAVKGDIDAAARDAARAASKETTYSQAQGVASQVARTSLSKDTSCSTVSIAGSDWRSGGVVTVRMMCRVSYDGLGMIGLPGSVSLNTDSSVPLDPYRRYE